MIYLKESKNENPYVSVNTLIKPRKKRESEAATPLSVDSRLTVSRPGDPAELEADQIAQEVARSAAAPVGGDGGVKVKAKPADGRMMAKVGPETAIRAAQNSPGFALPGNLQAEMASKLDTDFSKVTIHNDQTANESAAAMNAKAYTIGTDIIFNRGEYQPETREGRGLIAHELTHVAQQGNTVSAMLQRKPAENLRIDYPWQGVVHNCSFVNLRSAPGMGDNIIGTLSKGTAVTITGNTGHWLHVTYGTKTGYIHDDYIDDSVAEEFEEAIAAGEEAKWTPSGASSTNSFATWAREAEGILTCDVNFTPTGAKKATKLPKGAKVKVIGVVGSEYQVRSGGDVGKLNKSDVQITPLTLNSATTINCWEVVLFMAYRDRRIDWDWIHNLYTGVSMSKWVDKMTKPPIKTFDASNPKTPVPASGDIVFFDGLDHVSLATGNKDSLGRTEIYSFWPPPNTSFTAGGTLDKVKQTTIEELSDWMATNFGSSPTVTFASPTWR